MIRNTDLSRSSSRGRTVGLPRTIVHHHRLQEGMR